MRRLMMLSCLGSLLLLAACTSTGGGGNGPPEETGTLQITVTGIGATDAGGTQSATIVGLPLAGPVVTVEE